MTRPTTRSAATSDTRTTGSTAPSFGHARHGMNTAETKPAFKTTELLFYVLAVAGVLIAAKIEVGFKAEQAWLYISLLTIGYMISRGIAKAGSYANDNDPRTDAYPDGR
jgi:hypothetical protein